VSGRGGVAAYGVVGASQGIIPTQPAFFDKEAPILTHNPSCHGCPSRPFVMRPPPRACFVSASDFSIPCRYVPPLLLGDFKPCFTLVTHRYRFNSRLSYSILARGPRQWEVYARDERLPGSGAVEEKGSIPLTLTLCAPSDRGLFCHRWEPGMVSGWTDL
jgi:hypothetical protein